MQRRHLLRTTAASLLGLGLAGCGFHLRRPQPMPFGSLRTNLSWQSDLGRSLRAQLEASGVTVFDPTVALAPGQEPMATDVVLEVLQDQRERVVVGKTATGQVRELVLRYRFKFRVRTPAGKALIEPTELLQEREQSYAEELVLGKEQEELLLNRDMQSDIVRQLVRMLGNIKGL